MQTRRAVLGGALAATISSGGFGAAGAVTAGTSRKIPASPIYKVIFDVRQPAAQSFAREAAAAGQTTYGLADDPTSLWYEDLYHRWRKGPAAIAGMTTEEVALCLQMYAQNVGLRLVIRGRHRLGADGVALHRFEALAPVLPAALAHQDDWGARIARALIAGEAPAMPQSRFLSRGGMTAGLQAGGPLISWLMAPVRRT